MKLNEHPEPEQASIGKDQNATTPVSQIGDTMSFMNTGKQVGSNPEVGLDTPPPRLD
jgi:hypothetical protein